MGVVANDRHACSPAIVSLGHFSSSPRDVSCRLVEGCHLGGVSPQPLRNVEVVVLLAPDNAREGLALDQSRVVADDVSSGST